MARLNLPHPTTVEQALRQEIAGLERELSMLSRRTTATIQQAAPANILDPIEGQIIINHADGHKLYWYSNGEWHSVCDCEAVAATMALFVGEQTTDYKEELYILNPVTGDYTKLIDIPGPNIFGATIRTAYVFDPTGAIYYLWFDPNATDSYQFRKMNADGTGDTLLYDFDTFSNQNNQSIARLADGSMRGYYIDTNQTGVTPLITIDLSDGSVLSTIDCTDIDSGWTRISGAWHHPSEDKYVIVGSSTGGNDEYYVSNYAATTVVGPILTNTWDTNRQFGVAWNPLNNGQLVYPKIVSPENHIRTIDEDGTGDAMLYDPPFNAFPSNSPIFSPDGTMVAYGYGSEIYVVHADGSGLICVIEPGAIWWNGIEFDWTPDSLGFVVVANEDRKFYTADVATQTVTEIADLTAAPDIASDGWTYVLVVSTYIYGVA